MSTKTCTTCGIDKPQADFPKHGFQNGRQRYRSRCSECHRAWRKRPDVRNREQQAQNALRDRSPDYRESQRVYWLSWYSANRERVQQLSARRRALLAGANHVPYSRLAIFARWDNNCCYCASPAEHLDHVTPISRGGDDAPHNLVPACATCNLSKHAKTLAEWAETF